MTSFQNSTGRNADTDDSSSGDLLLANGWVDSVGLSERVLVVGELARVQPSAAIIKANTRMIDEASGGDGYPHFFSQIRVAGNFAGGRQRAVGRAETARPQDTVIVRIQGEVGCVLPDFLPRHMFKTGLELVQIGRAHV